MVYPPCQTRCIITVTKVVIAAKDYGKQVLIDATGQVFTLSTTILVATHKDREEVAAPVNLASVAPGSDSFSKITLPAFGCTDRARADSGGGSRARRAGAAPFGSQKNPLARVRRLHVSPDSTAAVMLADGQV